MADEKDINDTSIFRGDFSDFEEEDNEIPKIEELPKEEILEKPLEDTENIEETPKSEEEIEVPEIPQDETESLEPIQENEQEQKEEINQPELSHWEEFSSDNSVVKKYIVYISKDFVPYIDALTIDERTAYINDAIAKKIDLEDENKQKEIKNSIKIHLILAVLTIIIMTPFVLLGVHKAIMLTFENYKYSQDNFEKLYKQRFAKDKSYMRSLQYNKEQEKRKKSASH